MISGKGSDTLTKKEKRQLWISEYESECYRQDHPYEQWIAKWEKPAETESDNGTLDFAFSMDEIFSSLDEWKMRLTELVAEAEAKAIPVRDCSVNAESDNHLIRNFIIFTGKGGQLAQNAGVEFGKYFCEHPKVVLAYADEDEIDVSGTRKNPWFKPDWSPETLESYFYFGNVVAIRIDILKEMLTAAEQIEISLAKSIAEGYSLFWGFVLELVRWNCRPEEKIGHIDQILFHKVLEITSEQNIMERVVHTKATQRDIPGVSIIIPSKDHPELLRQCLSSIKNTLIDIGNDEFAHLEMIIVDNGSSEENRREILKLKQEIVDFTYLYEAEDFNFSKMCHKGAVESHGEVLLFLNDDIEAIGPGWLTIMVSQAMKPTIGAVGAKLYYPNSKIIQHVGITNMGVGPAHKLGGMEDCGNLYHGRNLADYNVIAVTAACLAVEKKKYLEVGGFCQELPVAYNDVDFCFSLYEKGYRNLVRNDVILYHHESVSRGSDTEGTKARRLLEERRKLYERHPSLYRRDPYYSRHLVQERLDGNYHVEFQYEHERKDCFSSFAEILKPKESENGLLRKIFRKSPFCQYSLDAIRKFKSDLFIEDEIIEIEGWCSLTDQDSILFERRLFLVSDDGSAMEYQMFDKARPDAEAVLSEQKYGHLCGFVVRIRREELPKNEKASSYFGGIIFKNKENGRSFVKYFDGEITIS